MEATCKLGKNGCWNDGKCRATSNCENKVITNADRIRDMSDEELAEFLEGDYGNMIADTALQWLKQPAEE